MSNKLDRDTQTSGFASAAHLADHFIRDGWSPDAVQRETKLPLKTVLRYFEAYPDRLRQWS